MHKQEANTCSFHMAVWKLVLVSHAAESVKFGSQNASPLSGSERGDSWLVPLTVH